MTESKTSRTALQREVARLNGDVARLQSQVLNGQTALSETKAQLSRAEALRQGSLDNGAQLMAVLGIDNTLSSSGKILAAKMLGEAHRKRADDVAGLQQSLAQERALTDHLLAVLRRGK